MPIITYKNTPPDAVTFAQFRETCGWGHISENLAQKAVNNSLVFVSAYKGGCIVGFGRVIGDAALNYYIQDLIVEDGARGQGIGKEIFKKLLTSIMEQASEGATVGLMSAVGKEQFYEQFGFAKRPSHIYGAGMSLVLGGG